MELLNLDRLMAESEQEVELPLMQAAVHIQRIARFELFALFPPPPPESVGWKRPAPTEPETPKEVAQRDADWAAAREAEWMETLPPAVRVARRAEMLDARYAVVARAVVAPRMTVPQVIRLGDDAHVLFAAIMAFAQRAQQAEQNGTAPAGGV